mmetsp:Transcript_144338/g.375793  ORF Transcript_144338/g.375793 Transcript_144338/m.375793 type:complete len:245 (-) Transcript_144338:1018-1752(-)
MWLTGSAGVPPRRHAGAGATANSPLHKSPAEAATGAAKGVKGGAPRPLKPREPRPPPCSTRTPRVCASSTAMEASSSLSSRSGHPSTASSPAKPPSFTRHWPWNFDASVALASPPPPPPPHGEAAPLPPRPTTRPASWWRGWPCFSSGTGTAAKGLLLGLETSLGSRCFARLPADTIGRSGLSHPMVPASLPLSASVSSAPRWRLAAEASALAPPAPASPTPPRLASAEAAVALRPHCCCACCC